MFSRRERVAIQIQAALGSKLLDIFDGDLHLAPGRNGEDTGPYQALACVFEESRVFCPANDSLVNRPSLVFLKNLTLDLLAADLHHKTAGDSAIGKRKHVEAFELPRRGVVEGLLDTGFHQPLCDLGMNPMPGDRQGKVRSHHRANPPWLPNHIRIFRNIDEAIGSQAERNQDKSQRKRRQQCSEHFGPPIGILFQLTESWTQARAICSRKSAF